MLKSTRVRLVLAFLILILTTGLLNSYPHFSAANYLAHSPYIADYLFDASKVQCPTTLTREIPPIDHARQRCTPMPSADPAFALSLCHDSARCNEFTLRISRTDSTSCRALEDGPRQLSLDADLDARIRRELGPDAFEIRTDGAERWGSAEAVYEGDCSWRFDVQLRAAGLVWLEAWHSYAVRERVRPYHHALSQQH
jgi:hypothetical protein